MKQLLSAIVCVVLSCTSLSTYAINIAPMFTHGHDQHVTVCGTSVSSMNSYLRTYDSDAGQTLTWTLITAPAHGTASISYTTTSTGDTVDVSGTTYTPTSGYTGADIMVVAVDDGLFSDTSTIYITVEGPISAGTLTTPSVMCYGSSATVSSTMSGGTWSASNSDLTMTGSTITAAASGTDTLYYIQTNICGADTATSVVTIEDSLTSSGVISGTLAGCEGIADTFTATHAGGVWSHTATTGSISTDGILTLGSGPADTVIYTRSNICNSISALASVTITPTPNAGTISGYDSVCLGSTIVLSSTSPGGNWISSIPDFADVDATGTVRGYLNGSTTIMYIYSNSCGADTALHEVRVNIPAQPIVGPTTICQFSPSILADAVPGGTWSSSDFLTAVVFGGTVLGIQPGTCDITYTVNNACGESSVSITIEVQDCSTTGVAAITISEPVISPNPSQGSFSITLPGAAGKAASLRITNLLGQVVKEQTAITGVATNVTMDVPAGVYMISATVGNDVWTTRIVIAK